ncbi:hypothetical protein CASFOL_023807 [Castilleja foliolosa]|uniref:Nucleoprotein n=1 Tax=Castilleja foliolosa TaxID=1961234 RepID=A0ABD3CLJ7_9LAMI
MSENFNCCNTENIFDAIARPDSALQRRLAYLRSLAHPAAAPSSIDQEAHDVEFDEYTIEDIQKMFIDGGSAVAEMREQKFIIEHLRNDQHLLLPAAIGMSLCGPTLTPNIPKPVNRYRHATTLSYALIRQWVLPIEDRPAALAACDAADPPEVLQLRTDWRSQSWFTYGDNLTDNDRTGNLVMAIYSQMLPFNCDIRDFGLLLREDMSVADDAWKNAQEVPIERVESKLMPYTLRTIAALNLQNVAGITLAAWVRAYGVSMGILPNRASKFIGEYEFTTNHALEADLQEVVDYQQSFSKPICTLCANIIAMFGIFHLNKDRTFRTNDPNMKRIGNSYIQKLRPDATNAVVKYMKSNTEAIVQTGPHPFGLAQTYWLARVLFRRDRMSTPLGQRIDTTPPPVQRVIICDATACEWDAHSIGKLTSELYAEELAIVRAAVAQIKASPPSYSELATLYGEQSQIEIDEEVKNALEKMMPCVFGYIKATHIKSGNVKDGLGFAMCLQSVQRDYRLPTNMWTNAWEKCIKLNDDTMIKKMITDWGLARDGRLSLLG